MDEWENKERGANVPHSSSCFRWPNAKMVSAHSLEDEEEGMGPSWVQEVNVRVPMVQKREGIRSAGVVHDTVRGKAAARVPSDQEEAHVLYHWDEAGADLGVQGVEARH